MEFGRKATREERREQRRTDRLGRRIASGKILTIRSAESRSFYHEHAARHPGQRAPSDIASDRNQSSHSTVHTGDKTSKYPRGTVPEKTLGRIGKALVRDNFFEALAETRASRETIEAYVGLVASELVEAVVDTDSGVVLPLEELREQFLGEAAAKE